MNKVGATQAAMPVPGRTDVAGEARLAEQLKSRDSLAWASLFDTHYGMLCRYAYVRLGSQPDAEDVASQVFLKALEAIHRYDYRGRPIGAWLYTIARNLVNQRHRRTSRPSLALDHVDALGRETGLDLAERIDLLDAVRDLKEEQREVIILRFSLGLSLRETAANLGRTEASVHSLQVRAVARLRARLSS